MKNKSNLKKLISSGMLVLCVTIAFLFTMFNTEASDENTIKYELLKYEKDNTAPTTPKGYLFAGWYSDGDESTNDAVSNPTLNKTYYAKFIPEEVLGIQAQISNTLVNDNTEDDGTSAAIRFVTSVDSTDYQHVGFNVKKGDKNATDANTTKYVYNTLYAVDATAENKGKAEKYVPSDLFHGESQYFKTWTIRKIPDSAYNTDITVTPYWVTLDGTRVDGTTSIKTINLGRSWVYINTTANADGTEYGTYNHPFTDLADALGAIVLNKSGKIVIQNGSAIKPDTTFSWTQRGKDLTITGESGITEALDFSNFDHFKIGDGVTFENMTLTLSTSNFYANGYRFEIAENVVSENSGTVIIGGGNETDVTSTNVTLLSGSYEAVYGGGLRGTVKEDTHITIRNANVYNSTKGISRVCGGGRNGNVTGSTYVTVGEGFNTGLEYTNDSSLSVVSGGGYGSGSDGTATTTATVGKNTYVVIEDGAKANYVYGAGYHYSQVDGTSHVTCDGGLVMSIYGGAAKYGANASTSVVMKDGTVEQIFGGNESGMTGNTDVRILGGNIMRRVYGGCYNNFTTGWQSTNAVKGYTSVTFGPDTYASLAESYSGGDATYYAVSRYKNTSDEIGVFIVNDYNVEANPNKSMAGYTTSLSSVTPYHYLVQSTEGGAVYSEGDSLRVVPDENMVATVRVDSAEVKDGTTVHAYVTSEGLCELPELDATGKRNVYVVFTEETPADVDLDKYEATANGTHYETLEEAISVANTLSTTTETGKAVVVTLLKNAEVEETLNIVKSANIVIENADGVTATVNRADGLTGKSLLNVAAGAKVTVNGIILDGRKSSEITAGTTTLTSLTKGSASLVTVSGEAAFTDATIQYTYTSKEGAGVYISNNGKVTMTGGAISNNYVSGNSGGAVSVYLGTFTMEDGTISNNTASASGGAFMVRSGSSLTINGGTISDNKALVSDKNGGGAIFQHQNTTIDINGGTISDNTSKFDGGAIYVYGGGSASTLTIKNAMISGNKAENSGDGGNGAAVYIGASSSLTLEGGATFQGNTATANGGAIAVVGTVTEKEGTSCTFTGNQAVNGGAIYVSGTFTMKGSNLNGNTASDDSVGYGGGVYTTGNGNFTMTGGSITANTAKSNGSGVYVGATGENTAFTMSGGTISGHGTADAKKTIKGNAVYVAANSSFVMSGTADISSNYSTATGNGVYVHDGGSFTMNGGTIQNNHTTGTGSGVEAYGTFTMTDGTISGNTAGGSAGGVIIRDTGTFSMSKGTIDNNTATTNGGGLYIQCASNDVTMSGGTISNNTATKGGGIYVDTSKTVNMSEMNIQNNTATSNGGGICVNKVYSCVMSSGTISKNTAVNGGGIYIDASGRFTLQDGEITANVAIGTTGDNAVAGKGSGVYVGGDCTSKNKPFNMSGGSIYGHGTSTDPSTAEGAGVYVADVGEFNLTGGTITDNHTTANGAGVATCGTFNMSGNSEISGNSTTTYGGGVYVGAGTFDMIGGSISNHGVGTESAVTATGASEGAGVCVAGTSVANMSGGVISNNYTSGSGAGVAVRDTAKFIMDGGTISDNTAKGSGGAMIVRSTRTETVDEQETAVAAFVMYDGTISGNSALVSGNNGGGAIYQAASTIVLIENGTISENKAVNNTGGAFYLNSNADLTVVDGEITSNKSKGNAGAIYAAGANKISFTGTGKIIGNSSESNVKAILLNNSKTDTQVYLKTTFTVGGEGYADEIRYNTLSTRAKTNPVLIIDGEQLDYQLTLGFHNTNAIVYIQCNEGLATTIYNNIVQSSKTSWTIDEPNEGDTYISVHKGTYTE